MAFEAVAALVLAASPATAEPVFACSLGAKSVSVTASGDQLTYRFGAPDKVELTLTGGPTSGNVHWWTQRYAGMHYQMRFSRGPYSYIVYSMEGNGNTGVDPVSGLVVLQGGKRIADMRCRPHAEFGVDYDYSSLPEDSEEFTAM